MDANSVVTIALIGIISAMVALLKLMMTIKAKAHTIEEQTNGAQMAANNIIKELRETNRKLEIAAASAIAEQKALVLARQFGELSAKVDAMALAARKAAMADDWGDDRPFRPRGMDSTGDGCFGVTVLLGLVGVAGLVLLFLTGYLR